MNILLNLIKKCLHKLHKFTVRGSNAYSKVSQSSTLRRVKQFIRVSTYLVLIANLVLIYCYNIDLLNYIKFLSEALIISLTFVNEQFSVVTGFIKNAFNHVFNYVKQLLIHKDLIKSESDDNFSWKDEFNKKSKGFDTKVNKSDATIFKIPDFLKGEQVSEEDVKTPEGWSEYPQKHPLLIFGATAVIMIGVSYGLANLSPESYQSSKDYILYILGGVTSIFGSSNKGKGVATENEGVTFNGKLLNVFRNIKNIFIPDVEGESDDESDSGELSRSEDSNRTGIIIERDVSFRPNSGNDGDETPVPSTPRPSQQPSMTSEDHLKAMSKELRRLSRGGVGINPQDYIASPFGEAGPSNFGEAGPSNFGVAGPSTLGESGPSTLGETGPSETVTTSLPRQKSDEEIAWSEVSDNRRRSDESLNTVVGDALPGSTNSPTALSSTQPLGDNNSSSVTPPLSSNLDGENPGDTNTIQKLDEFINESELNILRAKSDLKNYQEDYKCYSSTNNVNVEQYRNYTNTVNSYNTLIDTSNQRIEEVKAERERLFAYFKESNTSDLGAFTPSDDESDSGSDGEPLTFKDRSTYSSTLNNNSPIETNNRFKPLENLDDMDEINDTFQP